MTYDTIGASGMISVRDLVVGYAGTTAVHGVSFCVQQSEHVTLLGPSGCGKTTTLRAIAGLEKPSSGEILIEGRPVYSSSLSIEVPTERRGISMVFQSYAIWPHMTVAENVGYGLKVRGESKDAIASKVRRALDLVQLSALQDRSAAKLSGGQQQRVALARAIAFSPAVVLFDEPLSNLDAKLRGEMRIELQELLHRLSITAVYVTHDQEEALAMSDRIIVMNAGRIEQEGKPQEIYDRPMSSFVANFIGSSNILKGQAKADADGSDRCRFVLENGRDVTATILRPVDGKETEIAIQAAYLDFARSDTATDLNQFAGTIRQRVFHGDFLEYIIDVAGGTLRMKRPPGDRLEPGENVVVVAPIEKTILISA